MIIEEKLKNLILTKYRSIREFTQIIDMPYSTFSTIMVRGVENSSVTNVIKICKALGISADALANGQIVHVTNDSPREIVDVDHLIRDVRGTILSSEHLTLNGKTVDKNGRLLLADYLDVILELTKRQMEGDRLNRYAEHFRKNHSKPE